MRKILFIALFFCGLAFTANSQTLEFSQVLLVSSLDTVPTGKVWKVSNILPTLNGSGYSKIQVNGSNITVAFSLGTNLYPGNPYNISNDFSYNGLQGPYWLPEGTTLKASTNVQYISVIEFNK